jgi:hypothetical protein
MATQFIQPTVFYESIINIGGSPYPMQPNATQISVPMNWIVPPIIGNYWPLNKCVGLRQCVVDVSYIIPDDPLYRLQDLIVPFLQRTVPGGAPGVAPDPAWGSVPSYPGALAAMNNTIPLGYAAGTYPFGKGIDFWNGVRGIHLNFAKADSFVLSITNGQNISLRARYCGADIVPIGVPGIPGEPPSFVGYGNSTLLSFANVNFMDYTLVDDVFALASGPNDLQDICQRFTLSYSNNHNPDLGMWGSNFPKAQNAGARSAGLTATVQAAAGIDPGFLGTTLMTSALIIGTSVYGTGSPYDSAPAFANYPATAVNESGALALVLNNMSACETPDNLSVTTPLNMMNHTWNLTGIAGLPAGGDNYGWTNAQITPFFAP